MRISFKRSRFIRCLKQTCDAVGVSLRCQDDPECAVVAFNYWTMTEVTVEGEVEGEVEVEVEVEG